MNVASTFFASAFTWVVNKGSFGFGAGVTLLTAFFIAWTNGCLVGEKTVNLNASAIAAGATAVMVERDQPFSTPCFMNAATATYDDSGRQIFLQKTWYCFQ